MEFIKYPKIHRLGKEETEGILEGDCIIQEKIDGANVSIYWDDSNDGLRILKLASRNRELRDDESFNGFRDYVLNDKGIMGLLKDYPKCRLYGEWLVRHTISYNEMAYRQFYLFDITDSEGNFTSQSRVGEMAIIYHINYPQVFARLPNPTQDQIQEYVGRSSLGPNGEGVVIKNLDFRNKFGDLCYAKIVTENFKEKNSVIFGGNNKLCDSYWEMYIVNKYATVARVQKIMNKIQPEIDEPIGLKHTSRVASSAYHDLITEEIWEIQGKVQSVDFGKLKRIALTKLTQVYKDIINNEMSVAYA
jgi:hypothetical protein